MGIRHPVIGEAAMEPPWNEITIEYNGKVINGAYRTSRNRKTIVVRSLRGAIKEAPLGALTPLYLAKMLLRELEREGRT